MRKFLKLTRSLHLNYICLYGDSLYGLTLISHLSLARWTGCVVLVIGVPSPGKHISLMTCVHPPGKHISLVIYVPLPGKHISLVICVPQRAKKVVSDSPGLVDFAIGLVNSVLTCPTGK